MNGDLDSDQRSRPSDARSTNPFVVSIDNRTRKGGTPARSRGSKDQNKMQRAKFTTKGHFGDIKEDAIAMVGEFIGTVLFLLFALGSAQAVNMNLEIGKDGTNGNASDAARLMGYYYVCSGFGLSLMTTAFIFYRFTGSIFNPSVSLALVLTGVIKPVRFLMVATAQMVGGIAAAALLAALIPGPSAVGVGLGVHVKVAQGLFIEMFTTAMLTLSVLMLAAEKHALTPIAPVGFGFILFVTMMMSIQATGGAVNTARAFGPAVIEGFPTYHWIYWLGPTLGALLATAFYWFLKWIKYWRINPGQTSTDESDSPETP